MLGGAPSPMAKRPVKTRPAPLFDRAAYDAQRPESRSGSHRKPTVPFRPEPEELEAIDAAVARSAGRVTRNDWLRAAAREKLEREKSTGGGRK